MKGYLDTAFSDGKIEGKMEGIIEGKRETSELLAKQMILLKEPIEKIMLYTGLSKEKIENL